MHDRTTRPTTRTTRDEATGSPLPAPVQAKMEHAFSADFSAVRVHQGNSARDLGAAAYARGSDLHFAPGHYDPASHQGQALIGHELAHVVQQAQGRVSASVQGKGFAINADPALEREADELGERAARGEVVASGARTVAGAGSTVQGKFTLHGQKGELDEKQLDRLAKALPKSLSESFRAQAKDPEDSQELASWLRVQGHKYPVERLIAMANGTEHYLDEYESSESERSDEPQDGKAEEKTEENAPKKATKRPRKSDGEDSSDDELGSGFFADDVPLRTSVNAKREVPDKRKVTSRDQKADIFLAAWSEHIRAVFPTLASNNRKSQDEKRKGELANSTTDQRDLSRLAWVINQMDSATRVCSAVVASTTELAVYANSNNKQLQVDCDLLLEAVSGSAEAYQQVLAMVADQTCMDERVKADRKKKTGALVAKAKRRVLKAIRLLQKLQKQCEDLTLTAHEQNTAHKHCEMRFADGAIPRNEENKPKLPEEGAPTTQHSIGIAKQFCLKCALAVEVLRKVYGLDLLGPGHHMESYNTDAGWTKPDLLEVDVAMKAFLGDKAFAIYKKDTKYYTDVIERYDLLDIKKYQITDIVSSEDEIDEQETVGIETDYQHVPQAKKKKGKKQKTEQPPKKTTTGKWIEIVAVSPASDQRDGEPGEQVEAENEQEQEQDDPVDE